MTRSPNLDRTAALRVVVIGAGPEVIPYIEPELGGARYQLAFVDRTAPMYRSLRQVRPDVIVLCAPDDGEECRLLTCLQFDAVLRTVPLLVCGDGDACTILGTRWSRSDEPASARNGGAPCVAR